MDHTPDAPRAPGRDAGFDIDWRGRALAGEPAAVGALADVAIGPLYRFCLHRLGGDRHLCEEVVQETLLRAIRGLAAFDPVRGQGAVLPWLLGLARNEVRRARSRAVAAGALGAAGERLDEASLRAYVQPAAEPLGRDALEREETRRLVNQTMAELPGGYREALEGKYVHGQSVRHLADAWSVSEKAAESRLSRAREAFRVAFRALTHLNLEATGR